MKNAYQDNKKILPVLATHSMSNNNTNTGNNSNNNNYYNNNAKTS